MNEPSPVALPGTRTPRRVGVSLGLALVWLFGDLVLESLHSSVTDPVGVQVVTILMAVFGVASLALGTPYIWPGRRRRGAVRAVRERPVP
jgi:hypothetical protein